MKSKLLLKNFVVSNLQLSKSPDIRSRLKNSYFWKWLS